jgi:hypothetical protein
MMTRAGVYDLTKFQIEFRIHPNWRKYNGPTWEVKREANEIPGFETCINRLKGLVPKDRESLVFDLAVATTHKRPWSERRNDKLEKKRDSDLDSGSA